MLTAWAFGCGDDAGVDGAQAPDAAGAALDAGRPDAASAAPEPAWELPVRVDERHCVLEGTRADALPRLRPEPAGSLPAGAEATALVAVPGSERVLIALRDGRLIEQARDGSGQSTVLELGGRLEPGEGRGLLSVALPSAHSTSGELFVHYVPAGAPTTTRLSRFTRAQLGGQFDPSSELVVLQVSFRGAERYGGPLLFDARGMLLLALGDGGPEGVSWRVARDPAELAGKLLRIDVRNLAAAGGYAIPADNPPLAMASGRPEIFAMGLRAPTGCALDATGAIHCVDVGERYSELDRIEAGDDLGWPERDASVCAGTDTLCLDGNFVQPVASYRHLEGQCGARGLALFASERSDPLAAVLLHADGCSGVLNGLGTAGAEQGKRGAMGRLPAGVSALGSDGQGGVLALDLEGRVHSLTLAADGTPGSFPTRLSQTGCFALPQRVPAPDLIAFDVASPLWSDATVKRRFMAVPAGATIEARATGAWEFPVGTVLVKEFAIELRQGDHDSLRPLETRFMVRRAEGWEFHGYRWNEAGTDAELVGADERMALTLTLADGAKEPFAY